jgi:hypothetical protein
VLEKCFPTRTVSESRLEQIDAKDNGNDEYLLRKYGQLDVGNTVIKFCLDQTSNATANTVSFIVVVGLIWGQSFEYTRGAFSTVSSTTPDVNGSRLIDVAGRLQVLTNGVLAEPRHGSNGVPTTCLKRRRTRLGCHNEPMVVESIRANDVLLLMSCCGMRCSSMI